MNVKAWLRELDKKHIRIRLKSFIKAVGIIVLFMIMVIYFDLLDNAFFTLSYFIVSIFLVLNIMVSITTQLRTIFLELENFVYRNCDCVTYLKVTKECLDCCDECIKHYKKMIRTLVEEQYVQALIVNEQFDNARMFLQKEWSGKKNAIYQRLWLNIDRIESFRNQDQTTYRNVYKKLNSIYKRQKFIRIENMIMENQEKLAIKELEKLHCQSSYEECIRHSFQSLCYKKIGEIEKAKQSSIYLWEHGGQLPACKRAEIFLCEQGVELNQLKKKQYDLNTIHVICNQDYIHKRRKAKHTILRLVSIFGYIDLVLSTIAIVSVYIFALAVAAISLLLIQYSSFIMVIVLLVYMIYIAYSKKKHVNTSFEILLYKDGFDIVNEQGQRNHGDQVILQRHSYQLITSTGIVYSLYNGMYTLQEKQKIEQFVKNTMKNKIFSVIYEWIIMIGVFLLAWFTLSTYELYKTNQPIHQQSQNKVVGLAGKIESEDHKYSVSINPISESKDANYVEFKISLNKGKTVLDTEKISFVNDLNQIKKVVWYASFRGKNVYVYIEHPSFSNPILLNYNQQDNQETPMIHDNGDSSNEHEIKIKKIFEGYKQIYKLHFQSNGYSYREDYDAKGNSRIILFEDFEHIDYLVYDKDSTNGNCAIYVYYSSNKDENGSWSPMDAEIKDFFAYEYKTGKVVRGNKHDWSQAGSQEYVDIIGGY